MLALLLWNHGSPCRGPRKCFFAPVLYQAFLEIGQKLGLGGLEGWRGCVKIITMQLLHPKTPPAGEVKRWNRLVRTLWNTRRNHGLVQRVQICWWQQASVCPRLLGRVQNRPSCQSMSWFQAGGEDRQQMRNGFSCYILNANMDCSICFAKLITAKIIFQD